VSLLDRLLERIRREGSLSIEAYMQAALFDPDDGYYMRQPVFGVAGDFITAPEISQCFGEMLALWVIDRWQQMGAPTPCHIVECGPGRGTLMADMARVFRQFPITHPAFHLHLVEISPRLRGLQQQALAGASLPCHWHETIATLPPGPVLLVANEWLDAFPIQQWVKDGEEWVERRIVCHPEPQAHDGPSLHFADSGTLPIRETSPMMLAAMREVAAHIHKQGGAALLIDYGYWGPPEGNTLQAVRHHKPHPVLEMPGEADLTAQVDFHAVSTVAESVGLRVAPLTTQAAFLERLGIRERQARLTANTSPETAKTLATGVERLLSPDQMGTLFKVLEVN
jgi:NADH dehydrogenase [ubiquinone] 1 alpha subcomplex assembly factor 7